MCHLISDTDRDFDPSAEMLINEYDDERTLEEEENMSENSCSNELDELEKVGQQNVDSVCNLNWNCSGRALCFHFLTEMAAQGLVKRYQLHDAVSPSAGSCCTGVPSIPVLVWLYFKLRGFAFHLLSVLFSREHGPQTYIMWKLAFIVCLNVILKSGLYHEMLFCIKAFALILVTSLLNFFCSWVPSYCSFCLVTCTPGTIAATAMLPGLVLICFSITVMSKDQWLLCEGVSLWVATCPHRQVGPQYTQWATHQAL